MNIIRCRVALFRWLPLFLSFRIVPVIHGHLAHRYHYEQVYPWQGLPCYLTAHSGKQAHPSHGVMSNVNQLR
jgi:hypothetical protein